MHIRLYNITAIMLICKPVDGAPMFASSKPFGCFAPWHISWPLLPSRVARMIASVVRRLKYLRALIVSQDRIQRHPIVANHSMMHL